MRADFDRDWERLGQEVLTGMKEWRLQHPHATLREIEAALDERLGRLRARLLEDTALASATTQWERGEAEAAPRCPHCGAALESDGTLATRKLQTAAHQQLTLRRQYARCPACGAGIFPPR